MWVKLGNTTNLYDDVINFIWMMQLVSGSHWVSLFVKGQNCVYFDSYGVEPPLEVIQFTKHKNMVFNKDRIQSLNQNCCGYYAVAFLHFMTNNKMNLKSRLFMFCKPFVLDPNLLSKNDNILQQYLKNIL